MKRIYRNRVIDRSAHAYASVSRVQSDDDTYDMEDEMRLSCPSCPDGNEWSSNGPTGRACKTCGGKAYIVPGEKDER